MQLEIVPITDHELNAADRILRSAFQREESWIEDLQIFRKLQPDGGFLATQSGQPAGMVTATIYSNFAYIGWMGVHQDFQRQGIGTTLMKHVMGWLEKRQIPCFLLDATPAGQPLYESLGFTGLEQVFVFQGSAGQKTTGRSSSGIRTFTLQDLQLVSEMDSRVFGANRGNLLRAMLEANPGRAFLQMSDKGKINGYLIAKQKRIGPWVMLETGGSEDLLEAALSLSFRGAVSVVVPEVNTGAIQILKSHGFEIKQVNRHMSYGSGLPTGQRDKVLAQTSLSLG